MRVIAGQARGHKLKAPEGRATRPTTDRVKESLFNILAKDLPGCNFLDLCSGSGSIGIEALSRGAESAVFVDTNPICKEIITYNLNFTKQSSRATVYCCDVLFAIRLLAEKQMLFDIIFLDPPYQEGLTEPVLSAIVKCGILKKKGYVVVERSAKVALDVHEGLKVIREKDYKTTVMSFLALEDL